jgi:hypothetical protein
MPSVSASLYLKERRVTEVERDHMGREYVSGPASDNPAGYAPAVEGEPLERARRRAAGVGPLNNNTAGVPVWVVADRNTEEAA